MTDTYLRSLGFAPTQQASRTSRENFAHTWRYQFDHVARDGESLYIEHALGIATCRLSSVAAPLTAQDVFAEISLHDRPGLEAAISAFYVAHGGMGALRVPFVATALRPYRRQE